MRHYEKMSRRQPKKKQKKNSFFFLFFLELQQCVRVVETYCSKKVKKQFLLSNFVIVVVVTLHFCTHHIYIGNKLLTLHRNQRSMPHNFLFIIFFCLFDLGAVLIFNEEKKKAKQIATREKILNENDYILLICYTECIKMPPILKCLQRKG